MLIQMVVTYFYFMFCKAFGAGVIGCCELPNELNSGPLEKQQMFLTPEQILQPLANFLFKLKL